jgi:hypothetical protein
MTAYNARLSGKTPRTSNKKDGGNTRRRDNNQDAQFEALGFEMADWNKWTYTWEGDYPVYKLVPGMVDFTPGWVAICKQTGYQTPIGRATPTPIGRATPDEIKTLLDNKIAEIVWHEAELKTASLDIYPGEIGPEIDIDLWMSRPQEAARQATPAVKALANRHGISLNDADEMIRERGE